MKNVRRIKWLLLTVLVVLFSVAFPKQTTANASGLQLTANYDKTTPSNCLEIKLSVQSTSELTMVKYTNKRIANSRHFTKYEQNGIVIEQNEAGEYAFHVTENGFYSVFVMNKNGDESLIFFEIKNIDTVAPELSVTEKELQGMYSVTVSATDNTTYPVTFRYVEGAYASVDDDVWENAVTCLNNAPITLKEGKYTFAATDVAGNTHVAIRRFGAQDTSEEEFRAVWISYLEFKSTGYTEKEFRKHIQTMFNEVSERNMNAVVVHVRPFGDAMYDSDYFPWSKYVSGKQGKDPGFDPLEIMVEEAHARGLEFHAWLNPYRVTSGSTDVKTLSTDNPARKYRTDSSKKNDRYVLTYSGNLYYNPSVKQVQTLIINGIKEIVQNYDVDGIHFDDYFYPSLGKNFTSNFDAKEYDDYKDKQIARGDDYLSIADWRRENVNTLVKNVYSAIKKINPDVVFGISPGGFMDALKADDKYYVDFETWLGHDGYIDYLCPQLYWSNDHSIYPYDDILERFLKVPRNPDVKFYVGVAAYKAGLKTEGNQWKNSAYVLRNMIRTARNTEMVDGFILYRYDYLISKKDHKAIINMFKELNK